MTSHRNLDKISSSVDQCRGCWNYQSSQCTNKSKRDAAQNLESQMNSAGELVLIEHGIQKHNIALFRKYLKQLRKKCDGYKRRIG